MDKTDRMLVAVVALLVMALTIVALIPTPTITSAVSPSQIYEQALNAGTMVKVHVIQPLGTAAMATVNVI
jgi:hypothetical protein